MVTVGALGLFVLIFLSLVGSFECSWLLPIMDNVNCSDDVIWSLTGSVERSSLKEISVEPFEVVELFDDVGDYFFVKINAIFKLFAIL